MELLGILSWAGLLFFFSWFTAHSLVPRMQNWRTKNRTLTEIYEKHETMGKTRKDLQYHHDWALEQKENKKAERLAPEIEKLAREMEELWTRYHAIQSGKWDCAKLK